MTVTWADIDNLIESFGGRHVRRDGSERVWRVPSPTGGSFSVEVTLRPRWCYVAVDRWRTTDSRDDLAGPWFEEHVWPLVQEACRRKGSSGVLPTSGSFSSAHPLDRDALPDLLRKWIAQELVWGKSRAAMGWGERA